MPFGDAAHAQLFNRGDREEKPTILCMTWGDDTLEVTAQTESTKRYAEHWQGCPQKAPGLHRAPEEGDIWADRRIPQIRSFQKNCPSLNNSMGHS